jgi:hypothetical protein
MKSKQTHLVFMERCKLIANEFSFTEIQQQDKSLGGVVEKLVDYVQQQKKEEEERIKMYEILDKQSPGWDEPYFKSLGFCKGPLTKEARKKIEDMLEWLHVNPDENSVVPTSTQTSSTS